MKPTFIERFVAGCEARPEKDAMRIVGDESAAVTFGEYLKQVRAIGYFLAGKGVQKGDRVAVIGENHPCWASAYLGALYSGAIAVPLDPHGETQTLTNFLLDSEAKAAFVSSEFVERLPEILEKLSDPPVIVIWGALKESETGFLSFETVVSETPSTEFIEAGPRADAKDDAILIYTSGTTGKPKGVLLSHGNINAELDAIDGLIEVTEKETLLSLLPLFHVYLQIINLWISSTKGATVYYLSELTPEELSRGMLESRMTILTSVPRLWYLFHKKIFDAVAEKPKPVRALFGVLLKLNGALRDSLGVNLGHKLFGKVHDSFGGRLELAVTAGSRFDEEVAKDFHRLGFTIVQGYGLSETSGAATGTPIDDNRVGSVGKPIGDAEVKIDSPDEKGEGEVLIRGSMVFKGYFKNPDATKEAFTEDGWFRSGDLGKFSSDGHLYITGRAKDVIVLPSGKNVHPEDLEVHYQSSPLVGEICVIGVADASSEHAGAEKLLAVVVPDFEYLKGHKTANTAEAIRFELDNLGRTLPEYQRVRDYVVSSEPLPRTATRKIKRFEVKKNFESGAIAEGISAPKRAWEIGENDRDLLESASGRLLSSLIASQKGAVSELHPDMNLEIDLRLDSLSRAEIVAGLEQNLGTELPEDEIAVAFTFRDVVSLIDKHRNGSAEGASIESRLDWTSILSKESEVSPEIARIIKPRPLFELFAFSVLKIANLLFRIVFRLDVRGKEILEEIEGPFLICPNHQSYIDPFVVCSAYPYGVLKRTFHVGASEYFQGFLMRFLANMLKIVPIDPDLQLLKAMKAGAYGLKAGNVLNIYPEGERAFDGKLHKFKNGAAILATELGLPIVPVAIDGLHKVWGRGSLKIRAAKVRITFLPPLDGSKYSPEDHAGLTEDLRLAIERDLVEPWSGDSNESV
ncbi:MAG: AMP-binding protein [Pyrinomonadaceae bacterium]